MKLIFLTRKIFFLFLFGSAIFQPFELKAQDTYYALVNEGAELYGDISAFQMGLLKDDPLYSNKLNLIQRTRNYLRGRISCSWREFVRIETGSENEYRAYLVNIRSIKDISTSLESLNVYNDLAFSGALNGLPICGTETINIPLSRGAGRNVSTENTNDDGIHIVRTGETLWRISTENGLTVPQLKAMNNLNTNRIYVGQQLIVNNSTETVSRSDESWDPSVINNGVKVSEIPTDPSVYNLNELQKKMDQLEAQEAQQGKSRGEENYVQNNQLVYPAYSDLGNLQAPSRPAARLVGVERGGDELNNSGLTHKVQPGESLWRIAKKYRVRWQDLRDHNFLEGTNLQIGQVLIIPPPSF